MKQLLHLKTMLVTLLTMLVCTGVFAEDKTSTLIFTKACGGTGTANDGVEWTVTSDASESQFDNSRGIHYGTGNAVVSYLQLSTSGINGTITSIVVNASGASGTSAKLNVTVGGNAFGSEQSLTQNATNYTLTGSATGQIIVRLSQTSAKKALYVKSIVVTYSTETPSGDENPNNSFAVEEDNATIGVPYTMPTFTTSSDGAKSYSSSNTDVATISSNGQITLKKYGDTEITVTTSPTATYAQGSASYILHVAKGTPVLSFASETVTVYLGTNQNGQNGPALNNPGDGTPTYTISDPEVATIRQTTGYIEPLKVGTAIVTVTTSETDAWLSASASYTLNVEEPFSVDAVGIYELVTDASMLKDGDQILISYISKENNQLTGRVLGEQRTNNFGITILANGHISADKSTIEITSESPVTVAVLEGSSGAWYFHTNNGYLCAAGSNNSNYLKTTQTINDNAKATISIVDNDNAAIVFQGSYSNKYLMYNSSSTLFSCYGSSNNQTPVQLYRKVPANVAPTITFSPASGTVVDYGTQVTITARTATSITYSVNGGEPVTVNGTSATVTINTHTTIKATATNDYGPSEEVTAEYTINQESSALSYYPTEYTITIGDDFTAPEVNKPEDYNGTITYSSDNDAVAEVNATTGEVTIKAVGEANITASGTETEHYAAATASYKITVNKKTSAVSFAEAVVEITYGDNYNKQAATTEGVSGNLVYTSSNETVVKFHGNNVIDVLGPGTVTITATAPATDTTEESSATYTLKIYEPADKVEGATLALDEHFDDCIADVPNENKWWGSNDFKALPDGNGWSVSNPTNAAGNGCLKVGTSNGGTATSPSFTLDGTTSFSFDVAPWLAPTEGHAIEAGTITVTLDNATFNDGSNSISLNIVDDLTAWQFTNKQYEIKGTGESVTIQFSSGARFFLDNVVVGGGAQPAHEINLTFSSAGYLTWVATADIDFSQTEGVTAYQITEATPQGITAEEVQKAPAGAAVMLKGSGTVQLKRTSDVAALANNKMLACTDASVVGITGNQTTTDIYVLGNGSNGLGYYMLKNTLQAGKGYLNISGGASAKVTFVAFEETVPTGISSVSADSADGVYYNLQGVRVLNPQKGIYIKDGKKIVIK